ncbi:MAG: DUF2752 domain-containing protein [Candidatus Eremiobacteraeota bacterium]|nr:DUF2752 domain-containing protein [Candidatus Eremiobacteraeota bacterium]
MGLNKYFIPDNSPVSTRQRIQTALIIFLVMVAAVFLFLFSPFKANIYPPCPFFALTGYFCPGCGSLRGLYKLLHGDVIGALKMNPFMVLMTPYISYYFLSHLMVVIRGRPLPWIFVPGYLIWTLLVVILLFWFTRNLPYFPFTLLAPSS